EEMVYESRPGETFLLGASTWRIEDITFERVVVTPAPGQPGKMPFWHGDRPGRPLELGRALGAFIREMRELEPGAAVERLRTDDGIVIRLPEAADQIPTDDLLIDPGEIDELVVSALPSTPLFASRFRECAARALLLPRRRPDSRTPLWQQRQRAADLLAVAAKYPTFPIL